MAGDYRESTPRILRAVSFAVRQEGLQDDFCGAVPTPAILHYGMLHKIPSIMVTGSHVPDDRNGIKFNLPWGEILKSDERAISRIYEEWKSREECSTATGSGPFTEAGALRESFVGPGPAHDGAARAYLDRFLSFFPPRALEGARIVVYEHSSVSRRFLRHLLESLGAQVLSVGKSDRFVAVDTEAVENEDEIREWVQANGADALVSADGDGDRPLVADEAGKIVRGDVLGILVAAFLGAGTVCAPVSCNTALERSGLFPRVVRTRIGSPFVVEAMQQALREEGRRRVVGFEANGGFLTASELFIPGSRGSLPALPTRDACLPILCLLTRSRREGKPISKLVDELPARYTHSGLLRPFSAERGQAVVERLRQGGVKAAAEWFQERFGPISAMDFTDGARMTFADGSIIHLRPSGNAPEFRCYSEAASPELAREMNAAALGIVAEKA